MGDKAWRSALRLAPHIQAFMHPRIVHRDMKPHNIMLDASGRPKICDLGLSKGKDPLQSYLVTSAGGTPAYMVRVVARAVTSYLLSAVQNGLLGCHLCCYCLDYSCIGPLGRPHNVDEVTSALLYRHPRFSLMERSTTRRTSTHLV